MATYDMTSGDVVFVGADSSASLPASDSRSNVYMMEKVIDIAKFIAAGYTMAAGDVFQAIEIPANTFVLFAGAEVTTLFDGTTPTVDIDFAEGDDIVDAAVITSTGWCASGTAGQSMTLDGAAASTWTQHVTTTDTIDVVLNAGAADVTVGVLRVVACVVSTDPKGGVTPDEVDRDQLA